MRIDSKTFLRFFSSLKLAVVIIVSLTIALAVATFLESLYDVKTAQYWVYRAVWFKGILIALGINIASVAISRLPWKKRHIPFLLAHLGILMTLVGSWLTQERGIDGTMMVEEGESTSMVEEDRHVLYFQKKDRLEKVSVPWIPPSKTFQPIAIPGTDLKIEKYITHAEQKINFVTADPGQPGRPAIKLRIKGGPIPRGQDLWLWGGSAELSSVGIGPARFILLPEEMDFTKIQTGTQLPTQMELKLLKDGSLKYRVMSRTGKISQETLRANLIEGAVLKNDWMKALGGLEVKVATWIPAAKNATTYEPSRIQSGNEAPQPAIRLGTDQWLGLGERVDREIEGERAVIGFFPLRLMLPFNLGLERFTIETYPGTQNPASYWSKVKVYDKGTTPAPVVVQMNEPLTWRNYTFFQSSYIPGEPRPTISVFSVNYDPGRAWKYWGSLLIVLGSILLFIARTWKKKTA